MTCHRRPGGWPAFLALCALLLAGCGSGPLLLPPKAQPSIPAAKASAFGRPLLSPGVTITSHRVYLWWQLSPPGAARVRSELTRIDAITGRIEAERQVGSFIGQVLAADGWLWVAMPATTTATNGMLLRLNPDTLAPAGRWRLGRLTGAPVLAVAGGWLWVAAGDRLLRLSLPTAQVTLAIPLPGAASSDLSADAAGTLLVLGEADSGGAGLVQLRDPADGALRATYPVIGVAAPAVAGPVGSVVWISEATGMLGYVRRLDVPSLLPGAGRCPEGRSTRLCVEGTNDIAASLADGLLWLTQFAGGSGRNYCADPQTGRMLAPIRLPHPGQDMVLGIGAGRIFYAASGDQVGQYVQQEAVPTACQ